MQGSNLPDNAKTGATGMVLEQGLKVLNAIQHRFRRSLKEEYKKLFILNARYLDPEVYVNVLDDKLAVKKSDFDVETMDIMPIADPNLSSDTQRLHQMQFLMGMIGQPGVDSREIRLRALNLMNVPNPEKIIPPEDPNPAPPLEVLEFKSKYGTQSTNIKSCRKRNVIERKRISKRFSCS
jgi:hypothetical protein